MIIYFLCVFNFKKSISLLKAPFHHKDLQDSLCNLTSEYSSYRGGLYALEEAQIQPPCKELPQEKSPPRGKEINSQDVEVIARIAFVVAFAIFNVAYWISLVYFV